MIWSVLTSGWSPDPPTINVGVIGVIAVRSALGCGLAGVFGFFLGLTIHFGKRERSDMTFDRWQRRLRGLGSLQLVIAIVLPVLLWFGDPRVVPWFLPLPLVAGVAGATGISGMALWLRWAWGRVLTPILYWTFGIAALIALVVSLFSVLESFCDPWRPFALGNAADVGIAGFLLLVCVIVLFLLRRPAAQVEPAAVLQGR